MWDFSKMDELLIEEVRKREVLYNHGSPEYRDQQIRQEAWEEIGRQLQIKAEEAKQMWDKLRRCFCNAINRRRDPTSGIAIKKKHPWKYEEKMAFILPFLERRRPRINDSQRFLENFHSNLKDENLIYDEEIDDIDGYLISEYSSVEDDVVTLDSDKYERTDTKNENPTHSMNVIHDSGPFRKRKCKGKWMMKSHPKMPSVLGTLDETDLFFLSLSRMTKQLSKTEQTNIKMELSNAVLSAELRHNQKQQYSCVPEQSNSESPLSNPGTKYSFPPKECGLQK